MFSLISMLALHPISGVGRLVEVFRSHSIRHTPGRTPELVISSSQGPLPAQHKQTRRISLTSARFEPAIPAISRLQNYALDGMATGIGSPMPRPMQFMESIKPYNMELIRQDNPSRVTRLQLSYPVIVMFVRLI
jgi:hypothetical protein